MRKLTTVVLADDQIMFREGLAELLTRHAGMQVVGQTGTGAECVVLVRETKPDVIVMQVEAPFEKMKQTLLELTQISPLPTVIIVTMFDDPGRVRELMRMGVSAYLLKTASITQLIGAIRAATATPGRNAIVALPRQALQRTERGSRGTLSERQMEILLLAARGLSNRQIAASLRLAETTVKRHLVNVYKKMGVASRSEAINKALSDGWFTLDEISRRKGG